MKKKTKVDLEFSKELSRRIRERMDYLGITTARLTKATGMTYCAILSIKSGRSIPQITTLVKIAHALSMSVSELVDVEFEEWYKRKLKREREENDG